MHRRFATGLATVVAVLGLPLAVMATPGSGVTVAFTERATLPGSVQAGIPGLLKVKTHADIDVVSQSVTVGAGGHTGWHSHPGPVLVSVVGGPVKLYDGDDPTCSARIVPDRGSFVDQGSGHVHILRNEGTAAVTLYVTYLLPVGAPARINSDAPGNCSF